MSSQRQVLRASFTEAELHAKAARWEAILHRLIDDAATPSECRELLDLEPLVRPFLPRYMLPLRLVLWAQLRKARRLAAVAQP